MEREYQYDNIKAFLIFCVVLGHGLEDFLVGGLKTVYVLIYSFHVYFPFFLLGFYYRRSEKMQTFFKNLDVKYLLAAALAVTLTICYISEHLNVCWIYGSYDYVAMKYNFEFRIFFIYVLLSWGLPY